MAEPRYGTSALSLVPQNRRPPTPPPFQPRMTPGDRGLMADLPQNQVDNDPGFWAWLSAILTNDGSQYGRGSSVPSPAYREPDYSHDPSGYNQSMGFTPPAGSTSSRGSAGPSSGYGPNVGGPYPEMTGATAAGYLDPYAVRDPKTGAPKSYRPGTPEYAKTGAKPSASADAKATVTGAGMGTAVATKGGAPAPAKAPTAPAATGWEEEFYRTHGRFPGEWDYADKLWSETFARQSGRAPTREDWVNHAKENLYNPERPATPEFASGWGLDTGFGPYRPAPMSAVPAEVQIPGLEKGKRWEKPTGPARGGTPAAAETPTAEPKAEGMWGQLIPQEWDTQTTNQIFGQWLAEGGSGEPDDWAAHLQAIGAS